MTTTPLRPARGGFLRPFGCGQFIREFLLGREPQGAPRIDPDEGAPQADLFYEYKSALLRATALDRATRAEEERARREGRAISPEEIERLTERILARLPYRTRYARYSSFVKYFGGLQRLGWVEPTGREEPSAFQTNYPPGPPRRWYRLTSRGRRAGLVAWANPKAAEYPVEELLAPPPPPPAAPAVPERPRPRAAPPAPPPPTPVPPTPPPTAPAVVRPPTEIPALEVAEKPSRGAAQRLIAHLRKVEKVGLDSPEVKAELERLAAEVSGWASAVGTAADKEEGKEEPDEDKVAALRDRAEALESAAEQLEAGDVADAIGTLDDAWPKPAGAG